MSTKRTRVQRILASCERGRGKRYPVEVRDEVVQFALERRGQGAGWATVADELGLHVETLRRWSTDAERGGSSLARVEVVDEVTRGGVAIVSPSGFRLEGLDAASAVAALKALG